MRESESIRVLKGVGEKTEALFGKIGVTRVGDLLRYYPRDYDIFREAVSIGEVKDQEKAAVTATVTGSVEVKKVRNLTVVTTTVADLTGRCRLTWFNMPFLRNTMKRGMTFVFRGKVSMKNNLRMMEQPEIYTPAAYQQKLNSMQPIYALTAGMTNNLVTKLVRETLEQLDLSGDFLPEDIRIREGLAEYNFALRQIHFPQNPESYLTARKRLAFDEFLLFILALQQLKERSGTEENHYRMKEVWKTEEVMENLPYELTRAQKNVWYEIEQDLKGEKLMARLVQGDVGSGKTIIAFLAMIMAMENGYQSAVMVPTEVLARQHYESLVKLLEENGLLDTCCPVLLTGSNTAKEKRLIYEKIASGKARMIVGTHALIQEKVEYESLSLVITDEQHRFGVRQREMFSSKGEKPNVLVMSATPIPRTLGIILYGDLDISIIDELPAHRLPIKNCVVDTNYRPKAYRFIERQVQEGRQVYVICPMVEESEGMDGENVMDYAQTLRQVLPSEITVGILHGQMKPKEKNRIMEEFASGQIQVLVSTTVVEVGVNVPNATVMMVENAERFGLAQLHQLRGRVGRGAYQSYCIFIHGQDKAETSRRLQILKESNDGFYIAGEDLKLRGPGDLFGVRQSGLLEFGIADIFRDADVMKQASEAAGEILSLDFNLELPQNQGLRKRLEEYTSRQLDDLGL
ncbi:MAG: ATP-dependent DNA helicase RecG [Clostridiales bacterium]|nr:ATP-dependent DNA helicase RecG [Clostridiales bacterium]